MPEEVITPRTYPIFAPLNERDIVILGGDTGYDYLSDVLVFNVISKECKKVTDGGKYKVVSFNNQISSVKNKVIALVTSFSHTSCLIEWSFGQDTVTTFQLGINP